MSFTDSFIRIYTMQYIQQLPWYIEWCGDDIIAWRILGTSTSSSNKLGLYIYVYGTVDASMFERGCERMEL